MSVTQSLCEELPYWEFESEPISHVILSDGSVSSGIEILPLDIECFDESRINQLTLGLRSFVNSLPEGITCQFMVKVETDFEQKIDSHLKLVTTNIDFLKTLDDARAENIKSQIQEDSVFRPRLFFFIKTEGAQKPSRFSLSQTKKFSEGFEKGYEDRLQILSQAIEGASQSLTSLGFLGSSLNKEDLIELLYRYLNPKRAKETTPPKISPRSALLEGDSPRSQIVFGDLILDQEDFILDSMRTRVLTLKTLPEMTFAGMMSGFLALPFKYELFFSFKIPEQAKEMKSLEQKRRLAHSLASSTSNRVTDLESESRLSQTTELIREIIETGQRIFQAELMIVLREPVNSEGLRRLNLHTKQVLSHFK
ncbi:MAG TPA: TraC family protein, partial [Pseudobdellovibrionaceae bacterium]